MATPAVTSAFAPIESPFSPSSLPCDAPYNHTPSDNEAHWSPYSDGYAVHDMIPLGKISLARQRPYIVVMLQNTCPLRALPSDPPVVIATIDPDSHRKHFRLRPFLNEKSGKKTGTYLLFIKKLFTDFTI